MQNDQWSHAELSFEFCFSEVVDDKKWRKISHWLRESFRHAHFFDLTPSHRHELENIDITSYSYERVGLARKWVSTHGDALSLAIGATMSARVRQEGKCPVCNMRNPVWDHVWSCTLGMTPPDEVAPVERKKSRVNPRIFTGLSTAKTTILQFGLDSRQQTWVA